MADMENQEDQKISECLQEAFGYSDEQLLKQLDHVNENFKDVSFAGAEDRLMKRFMERKAEMERKAAEAGPETTKPDAQAGAIPEITAGAEECAPGEESKPEPLELEKKQGEKQNKKKIVRFGKKKALATAALVAVITGMLGGTAIGKKSYFFRKSDISAPKILLNNDKNKRSESKMEVVYEEIEKKMSISMLKLGYLPEKMEIDSYNVFKGGAELKFLYQQHILMYHIFESDRSSSLNCESDCKETCSVYNTWFNDKIESYVNRYDAGEVECEVNIIKNNIVYRISGVIDEAEFKKILENLFFF